MAADAGAGQPEDELTLPPVSIVWRNWDDKTFQAAVQQDRPILLSVTSTWCHWCQVMDLTTYADREVAAHVQADFVPIRVDTDRRPDISSRYDMGSWPMTIFLTPDGELLYGGTYLPPLAMKLLLVEIRETYRQKRDEIYAKLAALHEEAAEAAEGFAEDEVRSCRRLVADAVKGLIDGADPIVGGFGIKPKFPQPEAVDCLQRHVRRTGDPLAEQLLQKMLDGMRLGQVHDQEAGGYFRYATRRDWSAPHYEKLLTLNAALLLNYLHACQLYPRSGYLEAALSIVRYVNSTLADQHTGAFFASQAADEEYYHHRLAQREHMEAPLVARTVYCDGNARLARAYLLAAVVLNLPTLQEQALRTLDFLWERYHIPGQGLARAQPPVPGMPLWLADQAEMMAALLEAHLSTGADRYLQTAEELLADLVEELWDETAGGFQDISPAGQTWGRLKMPRYPLPENALLVEALFYLARVTGRRDYRDRGGRILQELLPAPSDNLFASAALAGAASLMLAEPAGFTVIGAPAAPETQALIDACLAVYEPGKTLERLDPQADRARIEQAGYAIPDQPVAYARVGDACAPPVTAAGDLEPALKALRQGA